MKTSRMGKAAFSFYKWLGFVIAVIISAISAVLGYLEGTPSQLIILYTVAIFWFYSMGLVPSISALEIQ